MSGSPKVGSSPNATGSPIRTLLAGAIDYAGLFPPAGLSMNEAVRFYAAYLDSEDAWALGRFVIAGDRLREFRDCLDAAGLPGGAKPPWRLSVLAGPEWPLGSANVADVELDGRAVREAVEVRAHARAEIVERAPLPVGIDVFFEIPIDSDPAPLVAAIKAAGGKAKVRTGGVTPDAFPSAAQLARFIVACARGGVAFKATAGLHHPLRARYPLTYEPGASTGEMFGFLNVLLAAAFARAGLGEGGVAALLTESDVGAVRFDRAGIEWRGRRVTAEEVAQARAMLALSFGSCSFREPIDELEALDLL